MINQLDAGPWLDWRAPQPVFIDDRLEAMGDELYSEYVHSYDPGGLGRLIVKYRPDLVVFRHFDDHNWVFQLRDMPEWRLIYADECAAIYAAKDYAPSFPAFSSADWAARGIKPVPDPEAAQILGAVNPPSVGTWLQGFYEKQDFPFGLMNLAVFLSNTGQYEAAQSLYLEVLRQSGGKYQAGDVLHNLGQVYILTRKYDLARICVEKALALNPGDSQALQLRATLGGG